MCFCFVFMFLRKTQVKVSQIKSLIEKVPIFLRPRQKRFLLLLPCLNKPPVSACSIAAELIWSVVMLLYVNNMHIVLTWNNSPNHTGLIILIWFITLKNNWMNPCEKTEEKCNESVNNEFKIMRKSDLLIQIMRVSK